MGDDSMKRIAILHMNISRIFPLALAIFVASQLDAQSPALATLVKASRLLDPRTGNVLSPAAVLIEGGKIKEVGLPSQVQAKAPAGAKTIDLGTVTLLPGLIDSHTHLLVDPIGPAEVEWARHYNGAFLPGLLLAIVESPSKRVLMGAQAAREDLESGITTVRNLGHSGIDGDTELRDAIDAGADSIEHGNEATDATQADARQRHLFRLHTHFLWRLFYKNFRWNYCDVSKAAT